MLLQLLEVSARVVHLLLDINDYLGSVIASRLHYLLCEAINIIQEKPNLPKILRQKSFALHKLILTATEGLKFVVIGDEISPLKHIGFEHEDKAVVEQVLNDFVSELQTVGILVSKAHYLSDQEAFSQKATVKVTCRVDVTDEEMKKIGENFRLVMKKLKRG
uniref:Uncharacterized protein n=1 Tax=Meloidogyne javanica TaxID=6303 RepID=A0A915LIP1_MELJA